ncbi:hypothetical protein LVR63_29545, partial [Pseudomonas aeruginosa]|nr:hypothetical protein [Pseudomonas aeruginosa]
QRYARPQGFAVISALDLPVFTVIVAIGLAALIGMDQLMQQRDRMRRPLHEVDKYKKPAGRGARSGHARTRSGTIELGQILEPVQELLRGAPRQAGRKA